MEDVTRGLIGRRVCGVIEVVMGVLLLLGAFQSANFVSIFFGAFIILTGILGIGSKNRGTVIAYTATGIICTLLLAVSLILSVLAVISLGDEVTADSTVFAVIIAALVITGLLIVVAVLGVIFACLPLCGSYQEEDG
ncbi:hypothetical protein HOLleu_11254 [Holothuria leucospilota]|uniref:Uncharacterized protein n=1 Tax=Holothuria leucospilota TaxID=206669 RepID=A0A9Q1CEM7_HOLLE|nr:hypothetical protein HOLleu_11254 [Holothuria leucospilota]